MDSACDCPRPGCLSAFLEFLGLIVVLGWFVDFLMWVF